MTSVRPLADLLRLGAGPLVWFAHIALLYGAEPILCRPPGPPPGAMLWLGAIATVLALAALTALTLTTRRAHPGRTDSTFLHRTTLLVVGLCAIGVIWTVFPMIILPACSAVN